MSSTLIDRAIVIWLAAALVVWTCCLVVLWGWAFDTSGGSAIVTLSAVLLAVSMAILLPGRVVRATRRVLSWIDFRGAGGAALATDGPMRSRPAEVRATMRLLAACAALAAFGGLASTGAILVGAKAADGLAGTVLFSPAAWTICKLLVQFAGVFPLAMGISLVFLATEMIRVSSGQDVYAAVLRDWLWAAAAGLAVFGVCWQLGVDLLGLAGMMTVALLGGAAAIFQRQSVTTHPGGLKRPIETPAPSMRLGVAATFATFAIAVVLQLRLLQDAVGVGLGLRACWVAASLAMLGWMLGRMDHKSHPPGRRQDIGARIGLCSALLLQGALAVSSLTGGASGQVCLVLAGAVQVPAVALAAVVLSRQRRLFAQAGGLARGYVSCASAGAGLALLGYLLLGWPSATHMIVLVAVLAICCANVIAGIVVANSVGNQLRWAAIGAVVMCAMTMAILGSIGRARQAVVSARPGTWLTAVAGSLADPRSARVAGMLPHPPAWRSSGVDEALRRIMADNAGRWLVAAASRQDLPSAVAPGVHVRVVLPDPSASPVGAWAEPFVLACGDDFFAAVRLWQERFDSGLLALLPAGHPQAWRCYNERAIRRFVNRLQDGGVAAFRIQATDNSLGIALAAARAFHEAVGSCWLVAEGRDGQVDILLAGPAGHVRRPNWSGQAVVVLSDQLWYEWPRVRPLRLRKANAAASGPTARQFISRIEACRPGNQQQTTGLSGVLEQDAKPAGAR